MPEETKMPYIEEYTKFIKEFSVGQVASEEVGELIVRMASYFSEYNLKLVLAERALALVAKENVESIDESSGKQISVAKADILTDASDEAFTRNQVKAHLINSEAYINALKAMQRALGNEYSHMGL